MTRNRSLLTALAALLVLGVGCTSGGGRPSDDGPTAVGTSTDTGTAEPTKRRAVQPGDRYVALGDSYTALGGDMTHINAHDGCGRSDLNYPHQIAEELDLELVDNSCGGAQTANLTEPQVTFTDDTHPPQLDGLTEDTALVTLRLGGNDHQLFAQLVGTCTALGRKDPDGSPCADVDAKAPTPYAEKIAMVQQSLVDGIAEIRERAPKARVLVVSYPQIIPESGTCPGLPLGAGDYAFARDFNVGLVAAQAAAAEKAGVEFVDAFAASEGHDICSEEPWIAGAVPGAAWLSYHPGYVEHEAVARLVVETLESD